jgi:hypothetical protein
MRGLRSLILLQGLKTKKLPKDFLTALPRNNTIHRYASHAITPLYACILFVCFCMCFSFPHFSASKRRSTANKKDLTKMDLVGEHKRLDVACTHSTQCLPGADKLPWHAQYATGQRGRNTRTGRG